MPISTPDPTAVAALVREAREAHGLSRAKIATRIGVSPSTIARLELEAHLPAAVTLAGLANVLGLSLDDLLGVDIRDEVVA